MKIRHFLSIAATGLLLAACSGNTGSDASQKADASMVAKGDSLVYYFGQMRGAEFLREAASDTALDNEAAHQAYLRGVKAGLSAVKAEQEAYNKGLFLGMQMAMNFNQFEKDYGLKLNTQKFVQGVTETINADSVVNANKVQSNFYRIMNEFNQEKEARDKAAADAALAKAAEKAGFGKISDDLYGNVKESLGQKIKDGDRISIDFKIENLDGKPIEAPFPKSLVVGQRLNNTPLGDAFKSLVSGETGTFLTTAQALFGARSAQLGIQPSEVLRVQITPTVEASEQ